MQKFLAVFVATAMLVAAFVLVQQKFGEGKYSSGFLSGSVVTCAGGAICMNPTACLGTTGVSSCDTANPSHRCCLLGPPPPAPDWQCCIEQATGVARTCVDATSSCPANSYQLHTFPQATCTTQCAAVCIPPTGGCLNNADCCSNRCSGPPGGKTCEYPQATLNVTKNVINNNGGMRVVADFTLSINGAGGPYTGTSPLARNVTAGNYTVSESPLLPLYNVTFGGDCDSTGAVTLNPGETKNCTITNDDIACSANGAFCSVDGTCCTNFCLGGSCACKANSTTCGGDYQCCSNNCSGGTCQPAAACLGTNIACTMPGNNCCLSAGCATTTSSPTITVCNCKGSGGSCNAQVSCCPGLTCNGGTCGSSGSAASCIAENNACTTSGTPCCNAPFKMCRISNGSYKCKPPVGCIADNAACANAINDVPPPAQPSICCNYPSKVCKKVGSAKTCQAP